MQIWNTDNNKLVRLAIQWFVSGGNIVHPYTIQPCLCRWLRNKVKENPEIYYHIQWPIKATHDIR